MSTQTERIDAPIDLRDFDDEFARAERRPHTEESRLEEVPDGVYETRIEDVTLNRVSSTGNPMIIWKLRIKGPQCEGRTLNKIRVITPKTLAFVKEDFERLSFQLDRLSELQERMGEMVDKEIRVFKKTNAEKRWTDVYFLRVRKGPQSESANSDRAWRTGTDDDLPF